ncbi:MAG: MFS transporter, partial [Brevibacterium linens]
VKGTSGGHPIRAFVSDYAALVRRIVRMWKEEHQTLRFFIASAVFRDGLAAIFSFAGVLAAGSYGFSASEIIILGVAANVSAGAGAMIAGYFDDRLGPKPVIIAGLVIILVGGVPILFSADPTVFWVCALVLSFCVGPVQASSRSFLARITPPESAGENFGLYATTGRAVSFLGPAMFAASIMIFGFQRAGTLGILIVLLIGLILIIPVKPEAPRRSMQAQVENR